MLKQDFTAKLLDLEGVTIKNVENRLKIIIANPLTLQPLESL